MAITSQQVTQAQTGGVAIQQASQALLNFAGEIKSLVENNWIKSVTAGGTTVNADFSSTNSQNTITAQYATLKAAILTAYNTLP